MKTHVALNTDRFDQSVDFYRRFFDREPVKLKNGYAKFELTEPGLNFTLNASPKPSSQPSSLNHLGIEVGTPAEVAAAVRRLSDAGFATLEEKDTECCYALQDKVWVTDPNGYRWEVFTVLEQNVGIEASPSSSATDKAACC